MTEFVTVQTPNGPVRFPKGMSRADMAAALNKLPKSEPQSPAMSEGLASLSAMTQDPTVQPQPRGAGQVIYDNLIGDKTDGVDSYGESLGTWLNRAGETMTLGTVGDEASAAAYSALPGRSYDAELERMRANESGMSTGGKLSADIVGAIIPALTGAGMASTAATIPGTIARGAAIGGMQGATLGFMEGEGGATNRMGDAATSGAIGAALGGILAPVAGWATNKIGQSGANRRAIAELTKDAPDADALRAAGNAAYKAIDDADVQIKPEAFESARQRIVDALRTNTGFDELPGPGSLTPNTARTMEIMGQSSARMAAEPTAALPFKSLDQIRRQAGAAAGNVANKTDARAGVEVIQGLDDFVGKLGPDDVVSGDVDALKTMIPKARELWQRMSKTQRVEDAIESGSNNYLGGAGSGIRNQFASILRNKKLSQGFTELEKSAMRRVVNGTIPEKIINLMGGGMGQLVTMGSGGAMGGIPGFLAGTAVAAGSRKASEAIVTRNAEIARALIAGGKGIALPQISKMPREIVEALTRRAAEVGRQ
jgi:hypothetical protein